MSFLRLAAISAAAMFLGGVLPSVASAADLCVAPKQDCGQGNNYTQVQDALEAAASTDEADRVLLGADEYVAPQAVSGFSYTDPARVEIVGAGRGKTVLTAQSGAQGRVLYVFGGPGTSIHDLSIRIPDNAGANFTGLQTGSNAERIEVVEGSTQAAQRVGAVILDGAALEDSSVALADGPNTIGVMLGEGGPLAGPSTLRGSTVSAGLGLRIWDAALVERSRVAGTQHAALASGSVALRDSVLRLYGTAGTVLRAEPTSTSDTNVQGDGLTIFAWDTPDTGGVQVTTKPQPTRNVQLKLTNSIVRGTTALAAIADPGTKATIDASYSDYDASYNQALGGADITEWNISNFGEAAGLSEQSGHELSLLPGSPLIDAGNPFGADGLDVDGNPRVADGNGDGVARRDIGAFELQPPSTVGSGGSGGGPAGGPVADTQAPLITGFRATRSVFEVARGTRLRYTLSENARVVIKIQRKLAGQPARYRAAGKLIRTGLAGLNRTRFTGRIGHRALRPGRYRALITATDAAGNRSARKIARFRIVSA